MKDKEGDNGQSINRTIAIECLSTHNKRMSLLRRHFQMPVCIILILLNG